MEYQDYNIYGVFFRVNKHNMVDYCDYGRYIINDKISMLSSACKSLGPILFNCSSLILTWPILIPIFIKEYKVIKLDSTL